MRLYREWALKPSHRRGCMIPDKYVMRYCNAPDAGYASVYMFKEQDAQEIIASGSSAGLSRYEVFTDTLTLDLDKGAEQLSQAREAVKGYRYCVFESGGKGYHIVISLDRLINGTNIPYSQRKWVEALNVGADLSLYQAGHIISLPGRLHPKTGKRKILIDIQPGNLLSLPLVSQESPSFALGNADQSELERGLWRAVELLSNGPGPGNRHTALWSTAKHFADSGLSFDTALDLLWAVNQTWDEPKTEAEVKLAVNQAFRVPTT